MDLTHQLQSKRLEITNSHAKYATAEKEINILREQIQDTFRATEQAQEDKLVEFNAQLAVSMTQIHQLQSEIEVFKIDKQSLLDDIERKQEAYNRLKDQLLSDIARLEKKVANLSKTNEDMAHEHSIEVTTVQTIITKLRDEIASQRVLIHEKTCLIENIQSFLASNNLSSRVTDDEVEDSDNMDRNRSDSPLKQSAASGLSTKTISLLKKNEESSLKYSLPSVFDGSSVIGSPTNSTNNSSNNNRLSSPTKPRTNPAPIVLNHSAQFLGLKEGIELVMKTLQYTYREEFIVRQYLTAEQKRLMKLLGDSLRGLSNYHSEVMELSESKSSMRAQIAELFNKCDGYISQEESAIEKIRQLENQLIEVNGQYSLAKESIKLLEAERANTKLLMEKNKSDVSILNEKLTKLQEEHSSMCSQCEKCVDEMLAAQKESQLLQQKYCVVEAERDELKLQYIINPRQAATSLQNQQSMSQRYAVPLKRHYAGERISKAMNSVLESNEDGNSSFLQSALSADGMTNHSGRRFSAPNVLTANSSAQLPMSPPRNSAATPVPPGITLIVDAIAGSSLSSSKRAPFSPSIDGHSASIVSRRNSTGSVEYTPLSAKYTQ